MSSLFTIAGSLGILITALWLFLAWRLLQHFVLPQLQKEMADKAEADRKAKEKQEKQEQDAKEKKRKEEEAAKAKTIAQVKSVLNGDPLLAQALLNLAKEGKDIPLSDSPEDKAKIERIAKEVPPHLLQLLYVASTQKDIEFDLTTKVKREKAQYPTNDIEPVPMSGVEQVADILPEQLMQEDEPFYRALANEELLVLQPYEKLVERKTLHILIDISPSMDGAMGDGLTRHNWARGIAVSLLLRAVRGEATYLLRAFDGKPYGLLQAATPEEAADLIDAVLKWGVGSDTNILAALAMAVTDVRERKEQHDKAEVLVITDGEDKRMDNTQAVRELLGDDIRLHVAIIGTQSPALQKVATSYQVFK